MKVAISCLGSRERYGMPVALSELNFLEVFFTDIYIPLTVSKFGKYLKLSGGLAALFNRNHRCLPFKKVKSFSRLGFEFRLQVRSTRHLNEHLQLALKYGSTFSNLVGKKLPYIEFDIFVAFTGEAKEAFEAIQISGRKVIKVLDQVDPGLLDYQSIHEEIKKHELWGESVDPLNAEYFERVREEYQLADHVIVNSEYSKNMMQKWLGKKEISILPIPSSFQRVRKQHISGTGKLRVLFLGTLSLRKGIHYTLEAFKYLIDMKLDVSLTLAGGCRIDPVILRNYPFIEYLGAVSSDEVKDLLDSHDVLLFPTLSEGFGIVQVEAISRGLPVISTKNCGAVIEDGVSGLIIEAKSSSAIAAAISKYYSDRVMLSAHSEGAYLRSEKFASDIYMQELKSILSILKYSQTQIVAF
jgi:glycosyltransferase involved in cell wall biosynthesis